MTCFDQPTDDRTNDDEEREPEPTDLVFDAATECLLQVGIFTGAMLRTSHEYPNLVTFLGREPTAPEWERFRHLLVERIEAACCDYCEIDSPDYCEDCGPKTDVVDDHPVSWECDSCGMQLARIAPAATGIVTDHAKACDGSR